MYVDLFFGFLLVILYRFICSFLWNSSLVYFILSFLVIIMRFVVFRFFCSI